MPPQWESNLPILVASTGLIPEVCKVFEGLRGYWWEADVSLSKFLSHNRWIFVESFLRYECFCNISYESEGFLFQNMFDFKHIFFKPFLMNTSFSPSELRPWGQTERKVKPLRHDVRRVASVEPVTDEQFYRRTRVLY